MSGALLRHTIRRLDPRIKALATSAHQQFQHYKKNIAAFWILHGANMMASDYSNGEWTPLFEDIYEEGAVLPPMERALDIAIQKFWSDDGGGWLGAGRAIGAWLVLKDHNQFGYYLSGLAELHQAEDPQEAIRQPHNDIIWSMFTALKRQISAAQESSDVEESGPEVSPEVQQQPVGDHVGA